MSDFNVQGQLNGGMLRDERSNLMLKQRIRILICFLVVIFMTGCARNRVKNQNEKRDKFQSDYIELFLARPVKMEEGYFQPVDGMIYYTDYETKVSVPICNKPECRHLSEAEDANTTCDAANRDVCMVFPYKGRLLKIVGDKDGYTLLASELDGSNEKEVQNVTTDNRMIHEAVIVKNNMYYTYSKMAEMNEGFEESVIKRDFGITRLNLDTMETENIYEDKDVDMLMMLGGTSKFQIFSAIRESGVEYSLFDYQTGKFQKLSIQGDGSTKVAVDEKGKYFYYKTKDGKEIRKYSIDSQEDITVVSTEEVEAVTGNAADILYMKAGFEEGVVFCSDPGYQMLWKEKGKELQILSLSEQLPIEDATFNTVLSLTKEGMFFTFQKENEELRGDWITWGGYISRQDLLEGSKKADIILYPKVSSMGNIVDKDGNVIGTESGEKYD